MRALDSLPFTFYGETFEVVLADDRKLYVPLRRLCDALGIDYSSQRKRVLRDEAIQDTLVTIPMETPYQNSVRVQEVSCLWLNRLPYWLGTIDAARIKPELKETVVRFKREFAEVAWAAFRTEILPADILAELDTYLPAPAQEYHQLMDDAAQLRQNLNTALTQQGEQLEQLEQRLSGLEARLAGTDFINSAQQQRYLEMVGMLGEALKKKKAGNQAIVHNQVKREFRVPSYQLIPESEFGRVVQFLARWYERLVPPGTPLPGIFAQPGQGRLI